MMNVLTLGCARDDLQFMPVNILYLASVEAETLETLVDGLKHDCDQSQKSAKDDGSRRCHNCDLRGEKAATKLNEANNRRCG